MHVKKGRSIARPGVVVQARTQPHRHTQPQTSADNQAFRLGFTASRKVGNAVMRNRAKRRLREAARQIAPVLCRPGYDYVFIARAATAHRPWPALLGDLESALTALHKSPR